MATKRAPKVPGGRKRLLVSLAPHEEQLLEAVAAREGTSLANYLRRAGLAAAMSPAISAPQGTITLSDWRRLSGVEQRFYQVDGIERGPAMGLFSESSHTTWTVLDLEVEIIEEGRAPTLEEARVQAERALARHLKKPVP